MSHLSRRVFFGSAAVALGAMPFAVDVVAQGKKKGASLLDVDPVFQELQRQFTTLLPQMEQGSAAATLQFAAALRTMAAWGEGQGIDAQMKQTLRVQKKQKGKSALANELALTLREQHKGQKKRLPDATPAQIEDGLDALARPDVTLPKLWRTLAADMEARAKQMPGIVAVQGWDGTLSGTVVCGQAYMTQVLMWTDVGSIMGCWAAPWACGAFGFIAAGYHVVMYYTTPSC